MNTIVIDSSVVIKWYLPEEGTLIASTIQDKLEAGDWRVFAPDLLLAEIANILWKRRHEIIETDALGILQEVISSGIEFAAIERTVIARGELGLR
jgi:predicted nucleic acid-binding protein